MKKKKIIIIISTVVLLIAIGVTAFFVLNKNKKSNEEIPIEVNVLEQLTPLKEGNSVEASSLIKSNIVRVTNKIDEKTSLIGTGFFDKSGYLVTTSHIVDIKGTITIEYADGSKAEAELYSNDITSDIALLAVEKPLVKSMFYGNTLSLNVTDDVYAIGYPYALEGEASISKGVLSARESAGGIEFLQSDISLNTGNSGGPLINDKAEVLGMNIYATNNASIGMSISSESLQNIIAKLIDNKKVNYLESTRPKNALSVVLTEIGYSEEDIYHENNYIEEPKEEEQVVEEKKTDEEKKTTKESTTKKKNSSALLSSLTVENYKIDFEPKQYEYYVLLTRYEDSLNISAIPADENASYTINNNSNFKEGDTVVSVIVKTQDGKTQEYKINVTKPKRYLEGLAGILCSLNVEKYKGVNSFVSGCDFIDSDRVTIYGSGPLDVIESVKIDVYAGWNEGKISGIGSNGKEIRFLKSYKFSPSYTYGVPLSEIRALLNDDDYVGGSYEGADLTFYITMKTRKQGTFSDSRPWGLSK